jgi:hypothetical protein
MKRVTASEARRNWFSLLDEVAAGGAVVIMRHGQRIVLRRETAGGPAGERLPDYSGVIEVPDVGEADRWGWEWTGPEGELRPTDDDVA